LCLPALNSILQNGQMTQPPMARKLARLRPPVDGCIAE